MNQKSAHHDFMTSWQEYQKTITSENECFDFARAGQTSRLIESLHSLNSINEKNLKGYSVLMLAAYNGHLDTTQKLISLGADVNGIDLSGNSILMGVAFKGHSDIARTLISAGASPNYTNAKSQNALQFAEMFSRREVIEILKGSRLSRYQMIAKTFKAWAIYLLQRRKRGHI